MAPFYQPLRSRDLTTEADDIFWEKKTSKKSPAKLGAVVLILCLLLTNIITLVYFSAAQKRIEEPIPRDYGEVSQTSESHHGC